MVCGKDNLNNITVKKEYDIAIIGGGPGGYETALYADKNGLSVCLIEENEIGGTCLNRGCIPTKTLYHFAKELTAATKLSNYIDKDDNNNYINNYKLNYQKVYERKEQVIIDLKTGINFLIDKSNIDFIKGHGKVINNNTIEVLSNDSNDIINAKNIIIATGSKPLTGIIEGDEYAITSNDLLNMKELPESLLIIGAGVIGIEMASIFSKFGVNVEVIEMCDTILPNIDKDISKRLASYLQKIGVKFHLKSTITKIIDKNTLEIKEKNETKLLKGQYILMSVGRRINIDNLFDENLNIDKSRKGIIVNDNFETNISNIYAIGDVNGKNMLAHYATYSGKKVIDKIINKDNNTKFDLCPACVFTFPELGIVGEGEDSLKQKNIDYKVLKSMYRANGKALSMDETDGFVKCIISGDKLLGVSIIGEGASDIIHQALILLNKNISLSEFKDYIYAHPTLSEIFKSCFE